MATEGKGGRMTTVVSLVIALIVVLLATFSSSPAKAALESAAPAACPAGCEKVKPAQKAVAKKKPAKKPVASKPIAPAPQTAVASTGCVEIHFPTKPGDTAVRISIQGPEADIAKDACTGIMRAGDASFSPWMDGFCPTVPAWVCNFSHSEQVTGKKIRLTGSYLTKPGEHVLRLPAYFADESKGFVTVLALIRGDASSSIVLSGTSFSDAYAYGSARRHWLVEHSTDAMGVRWFDYPPGSRVAQFYYAKEEVPQWAAKLYFPPWGEFPTSQ